MLCAMRAGRRLFSRDEVLRFSMRPKSRTTVLSYYLVWRSDQGIVRRCDNPACTFHQGELRWNGKELPLILDHVNGNSHDNRTENLRLLCPNCDSQLATRGGRNKGRIQKMSEGGFEVAHRDGRRDCLVAVKGVSLSLSTEKASVTVTPIASAQQPVAADGDAAS